jgi:hypothetical protein
MTVVRIFRCLLVAAALASLALLAIPGRGSADEIAVTDLAGFDAALDRAKAGDVIHLGAVRFPVLQIKRRSYPGKVRIVGTALTTLAGLRISWSRNISVENVIISPFADTDAKVPVDKSSAIEFNGVRFVGGEEKGRGVELDIGRGSFQVSVVDSEFTLCRSGRPCLQPGGRDVSVLRSNFHDCYDCDMIRGGGSGVTISGNTFERAFRGSGKNHNDLIQIMGGGPWTIVGNRFGERDAGAASVYLNPNPRNATNPIHDVKILSNIFHGDMNYAIRVGVGQKSRVGAPRETVIANNTILAGRTSAIWLTDPWEQAPVEQRPVIANNILAMSARELCGRARTFSNLVFKGAPCGPSDRVGRAQLDASAAPLPGSTLVIDRADPAYAPASDYYGRSRRGPPDLGAIEFAGPPDYEPLRLLAPARLTPRVAALRARKWRLPVPVTVVGAQKLSARLIVRGRSRTAMTRTVRGLRAVMILLFLPGDLRRPGPALVSLQASSSDGRLAQHTVRVQIRL